MSLSRFNEYIKNWHDLKNVIHSNKWYSKAAITYKMEFRNFSDWSLVYDDYLFQIKPPYLLKNCMSSNITQIQTFITHITDIEIKRAKEDFVNDFELAHACDLKSIINYALKARFPQLENRIRHKTIAGDFRPKRYFTNDWERNDKKS